MELASLLFRFILGFVFTAASIPKLVAREEFARAVANYRLLPHVLVGPVARWLPMVELAAGVALMVGVALAPVALLGAVMLLVFSVAVALNLLRGRRIECGCAGASVPRTIGWPLVARDLVLAGFALAIAFAPSETLAFPLPWPVEPRSTVSAADAVALALIAALLVVGESLVHDVRRTRAARRTFATSEFLH